MNIQITARHYHASRQLHKNLVDLAESLFRFNDSVQSVRFVLDAGQTGIGRAEGVVKIRDKAVVAHAEAGAMGKALEMMLEKLERLLKRENEKFKIHRGESLSAVAAV